MGDRLNRAVALANVSAPLCDVVLGDDGAIRFVEGDLVSAPVSAKQLWAFADALTALASEMEPGREWAIRAGDAVVAIVTSEVKPVIVGYPESWEAFDGAGEVLWCARLAKGATPVVEVHRG